MMDKLRLADAPLVTGLVTSPAWAAPLESINAGLTTVTLVAGSILGLLRIWFEIKRMFRDDRNDRDR